LPGITFRWAASYCFFIGIQDHSAVYRIERETGASVCVRRPMLQSTRVAPVSFPSIRSSVHTYVHIIYQSFFHYPFISSAISLYILYVTQLLRRLDSSAKLIPSVCRLYVYTRMYIHRVTRALHHLPPHCQTHLLPRFIILFEYF
jgi:hypothetical protein